MFYVSQLLFPLFNLLPLLFFTKFSISLCSSEMFINFSELNVFDIFIFLFQEELFSLALLISFSSTIHIRFHFFQLLLFSWVDFNSFLLTVLDYSFKISFSFTKLVGFRFVVILIGISLDLMILVESKLIVGIVIVELWAIWLFVLVRI